MTDRVDGLSRRRFLGGMAAAAAGPLLGVATAGAAPSSALPSRAAMLATMRRVNDAWIAAHPDPGGVGWARSTYFSGDLRLYRLSGDARYRTYAETWATRAGYRIQGTAPNRHADAQCAGQAFYDLHDLDPDPTKVASIEGALGSMVHGSTPRRVDDWWWVDSLHMAMPGFVRAAQRRKDPAYLDTLHALYSHTRNTRRLWSPTHGLWYRDSTRARISPSGAPVFWSRGNGWAMAAHAKVLGLLGPDAARWPTYAATLVAMAASLRTCQRSDGFWNVNLADPTHLPGPETSGTALFAFGIAHGIATRRLPITTYLPVAARAWNGMVATAVQPDGTLGFVQGVSSSPEGGQPISATSTADFGVGAFLMAGTELARLARGSTIGTPARWG